MAVLLVVCAHGSATAADGATPAEVQARVQREGARSAVEVLYRDQAEWRALLSGIATGRAEWLSVANALHAASDAGPSEQLTLAVGEALAHHPERVLASSAREFGLAAVCGGPDVDDARFNSYGRSMAAIAERQRALRAVTDPSLVSARDSCIATLESSKADIARFFGTTK